MQSVRRVLAHAFALTLFLAAGGNAAAASSPPRPRLAVIVSVDGLSWERLVAYRPWYVAGLSRLLSEGRVENATRYAHLNTETGPGHASLGTGAPPRVTGIVANRWFEARPDGTLYARYCTDQPAPSPEGNGGTIPGPANLRVPTLGDRLVAASPRSRVVSLSGKDRGAIFLAGKNPAHAVYWYDHDTGRFVSSAAYDARPSTAAAAVSRFNRTKTGTMLPSRFGFTWKKLASAPPPSEKPLPPPARDITDFQVPIAGLGFDHDLTKGDDGYFDAVYYTPIVDELTVDLALDLLADAELKLGKTDVPDLLCLSLSAQDTVSHNYGNESEENLDVLRRLDVQLGRLLSVLDASFPKGAVALALSSDHGFSPIPEVALRTTKGFKGGRLVYGRNTLNPFLERLNRALDDALCLDPSRRPLYASEGFNLVYNHPVFPSKSVEGPCGPAGREVTERDLDAALPLVVKQLFSEEVSEVLLVSKMDTWDPKDPAVPFARNAFDRQRSGDALLVPRPGVQMHWDPGRGSNHGSHHEENIHVPLLFWGGGIPAGASEAPSTPYDLAPTMAKLLGVSLPDAVGKPLF
jgi:hypothetical protein